MDAIIPHRSAAYRQLDVSILHHLIIDRLLGIRMETHKLGLNIEYIKEADEAVQRVADGSAEVIFLMNPTKVTEVRDVAAAGERIPRRPPISTPRFSGVVVNVLE